MRIRSASGEYRVRFCKSFSVLSPQILSSDPTHLLVDGKIYRTYGNWIRRWIPPGKILSVRASETQKSLEQIPRLIEALLRMGIRKNSVLLVIGGGVIQDLGCFIASVLFRGIRWNFVPTTLLAQADSCIGGKSSINLAHQKNPIGTFHPPCEIWVCPIFLQTLPNDQYRSGVGEIIKLLWIRDVREFSRMMRRELASDVPRKNVFQILALIRQSLQTKKNYIEKDEFDVGPRRILNFGHTFGHAFESMTRYAIPHGVAVTLGMVAASFFSEFFFQGPRGCFAQTRRLCFPWFHPYQQKFLRLSPFKVVQCMAKDKKNRNHKIQLILPDARGKPQLAKPCDKALLLRGLRKFFYAMNAYHLP
jgi:3-dehydroquinate synthase